MEQEFNPRWEVFDIILRMSDDAIEGYIKDKIREFLRSEDKQKVLQGLLYVIDHCIAFSLTSGVVLTFFQVEYERLGGPQYKDVTPEFAPWREDLYKEL